MDPAQGETQGKSMTSKLKAKVKGVKGKVHLPGHKKRHGDGGQANEGDSSDYSSDDSPKKPGPETGYNVGSSTPFTTVKATPLSQARETTSHNRDHGSRPSGYDAHHHPLPTMEEKSQYRGGGNTSSTTEGMAKMGLDERQSTPNKPKEGGMLANLKDTVGGAAAAVGSKMGYYTEVDQTPVTPQPTDPNAPSMMDKAKASLGMDKPQDPNAPTLMEKTKASLGMDKPQNPNAPTLMEKTKASLGMDKPQDPNAPTLMEKTKASLGMDKPRDPNAPTVMEKTKASLGMDKPRDPNAPTVMDKTKATLGLGTSSSPNSETSPPVQPGVVDRVSGAISSLLGGSPKESSRTGEDVQHTFPAQSDYVRPAATTTGPHQFYGDRSGEERMAPGPTGGYNQTMNRY